MQTRELFWTEAPQGAPATKAGLGGEPPAHGAHGGDGATMAQRKKPAERATEAREPKAPEPRARRLADFAVGDSFRGTFLLQRAELKTSRTGKDFLTIELSDASGVLSGTMFDVGRAEQQAIQGLDVVEAWGKIQTYNGKRSAVFDGVQAAPAGIDVKAFLPRTPKDIPTLYRRLLEILSQVKSLHIRALLRSFLEEPDFRARFLEAPAAVTNHHAYVGGLVEHIVSLLESVLRTCEAYPSLDRDLMIAGAFLHDIGKVEELMLTRGLDYSDTGRLVGHIVTGVIWIEERARRIEGFPKELLTSLKHLVLSHHGELEWGSPVQPLTAEAIALHALDNLDAKLWAFEKAVADARENGGSWTEYTKVFGRRMFKGTPSS